MLAGLIADENGMITLDGSDIPEKGKESVGVARQCLREYGNDR